MGNSHKNLLFRNHWTNSVGGLKGRTQFWKGITQGSFQQSLVEIGSVVSEENIFFLIASHHFTIFSLATICPAVRPFDQDGSHSRTQLNIEPYGKFTYKSSLHKPLDQFNDYFINI
jgi:hypothetical protein